MQLLLESPVAVAAIGLLLVAIAGVVYSQRRSTASLAGVALAALLAIGGVAAERVWQTPTERVQQTIAGLFEAVRANDLPAVLALVDPSAAAMRADAQTLMPQFRVDSAGTGGEVRVGFPEDDPSATTATARLKPIIKVRHTKSGATGAYFDSLELDLVLKNDAWLLKDYRPAKDWRDGANRLGK